MDSAIKLSMLAAALGVAGAAVNAIPTSPVGPVGGLKKKKGKFGGCSPCQGRADANATLRDAAKQVGLPAGRAIPKGGI